MSKKPADKKAAESVIEVIREGLESKKCRRCGKMLDALGLAEASFARSDDVEIAQFAGTVRSLRADLPKKAYDSLGCSGCSGAKVKKALGKGFQVPKAKDLRRLEPKEQREIVADEPIRSKADKDGRFQVEIQADPPLIRCRCFSKKGRLEAVVVGSTADAVADRVVRDGLAKRSAVAARLGLALARAERGLLDGP